MANIEKRLKALEDEVKTLRAALIFVMTSSDAPKDGDQERLDFVKFAVLSNPMDDIIDAVAGFVSAIQKRKNA